jgi:hypothetical protein
MNVQSGDSPENNLSKFGILPDMKVEKRKEKGSFSILVTCWKVS